MHEHERSGLRSYIYMRPKCLRVRNPGKQFFANRTVGINRFWQVPTQIPAVEEERQATFSYPELLYAHLLDADGSRLTYTHFTSRVVFRSLIEISFNRPIYIQRNKVSSCKTLRKTCEIFVFFQVYKVGVVLNKIGRYPIGTYPSQSTCNGVVFTFSQGQSGDSVRDGLVRGIIFSIPSSNHNSINNPGISGIPGDHNKMSNII
jgi:hypothetical protein